MKKLKWFFIGVVLAITAIMIIGNQLELTKPKEPQKIGQLTLHTSEFPMSFNYLINNAADSAEVFGLVYDSLMELDPNTLEFKPLLAKKWTVSSDKKTFTIELDSRAKWADGKSITTDDIKFTYDTIMNPKNLAPVQRMYLGRLNPPQIIDKHTIIFTAKTVHYNNLVTLAGLSVIPQHLFEGKDFNKAFNMLLPPGSGPYILSDVKEGRYYTLTRRKDYWADILPHHRATYNFAKIKYKVMSQDSAFEAFKKGDFDIYDEINPKRWVKETNTKHFQKNWIVKQKIYNYAPRGFYGLPLNMRNPLFADLKVRKALFYLLDREYITKKIRYNQEKPLTSYWRSLYGNKPANYQAKYDPQEAKKLLQNAGYNRLDKQGYLVNNKNQRLEFTILYVIPENETFLTLYVNTCKKAGVKVNLSRMSWATMIKKMDEYKFDALVVGWSGTNFDDPEQLWHSKRIKEISGSNLPGYNNPKVDRIIDSLPPIFDAQQRNERIKEIDRIIYSDTPYILLWGRDYSWLFYKNIFGHPKTVYQKYSGDIIKYWWFDPKKAERYKKAVNGGTALPPEPVEVHYDKAK